MHWEFGFNAFGDGMEITDMENAAQRNGWWAAQEADALACIFQPGDKVAWEFTPPLARFGLAGEMRGRFVSATRDGIATVAVDGPDGIVYRKIELNRLYIKQGGVSHPLGELRELTDEYVDWQEEVEWMRKGM